MILNSHFTDGQYPLSSMKPCIVEAGHRQVNNIPVLHTRCGVIVIILDCNPRRQLAGVSLAGADQMPAHRNIQVTQNLW